MQMMSIILIALQCRHTCYTDDLHLVHVLEPQVIGPEAWILRNRNRGFVTFIPTQVGVCCSTTKSSQHLTNVGSNVNATFGFTFVEAMLCHCCTPSVPCLAKSLTFVL